MSVKVKITLTQGLPQDRVLAKLQYHNQAAGVHRRAVAFYLCDVDDRGLYRHYNAPSTAVFAERVLGIREKAARELVRIERRLKELKKIEKAFNKGKICWSKVREICRVATPETEEAWLEFARRNVVRNVESEVSGRTEGELPRSHGGAAPRPVTMKLKQRLPAAVHQLVDTALAMVMDSLGENTPPEAAWKVMMEWILSTYPQGQGGEQSAAKRQSPYRVVFHVDRECREAWIWGEKGRVAVPLEAALQAVACGDIVTARDVENPGEDAYTIRFGERGTVPEEERDPEASDAVRAVALARDGYTCQACGSRRNLNVHHLEARAHGGKTRVEFLLVLCAGCHSLQHDHLLQLRFTEEGGLVVLDQEGRPVNNEGGPAAALEELSEKVPAHVMEECPLTVLEIEEKDEPDLSEVPEAEPEPEPEPRRLTLDDIPSELANYHETKELLKCLEWSGQKGAVVIRRDAELPDFLRRDSTPAAEPPPEGQATRADKQKDNDSSRAPRGTPSVVSPCETTSQIEKAGKNEIGLEHRKETDETPRPESEVRGADEGVRAGNKGVAVGAGRR